MRSQQPVSLFGQLSAPQGEEVASYKTYLEAQQAVDHLSDEHYDVKVLTIVGTDLRLVERITGRLTWGKVIWDGALGGLWTGLFIALLFALWTPNAFLPILLVGLAMGAIFGIMLNVVPYALSRGQRDFTSATQVVASRYAVLATQNVAEFRAVLQNSAGNLTRPALQPQSAPDLSKPSAFGSRPDEEPKYGVRLTQEEKAAHARGVHPTAEQSTDPVDLAGSVGSVGAMGGTDPMDEAN